jgi:hypothetical protein
MKDRRFIEETLKGTAKRRRWQQSWQKMWKGFFWGASIWLTNLIVFKLVPIPFASLAWSGAFWLTLTLAGFIRSQLTPINLYATAHWVDQQYGLKERFSALLEFKAQGEWADCILKDALRFLDRIQPGNMVPFKLPSLAKGSCLVLALSAGLGFIPEYRTQDYLLKKKQEAYIRSSGEHLVKFTQRRIQQHTPALPSTERTMQTLEQLGMQLSEAKLGRKGALREITNVMKKVEKQQAAMGLNPAFHRLQQSASNTTSDASSEKTAAMKKRMETLTQRLGEKMNKEAEIRELARSMDQAMETASNLGTSEDGINPSLSQSLSQQLNEMAQSASEIGLSAEQIQAALSSLHSGNLDKLMEGMHQSRLDLENMLKMAEELQDLETQLKRIGKDLAEQLRKGQSMAAKHNLLSKAESITSGHGAAGTTDALVQELKAALPEAAAYGKVQTFLKQAIRDIDKGQYPSAAQSLRSAAMALQELGEQFGDMQSLTTAMENLMKAQMCIGNSKGWGQYSNPSAGFSQGGKPGKGLGSWGNEGGEWLYRKSGVKGNAPSGIQRPEMEARGLSERGEATLPEGLRPSEVKGSIRAGAPMPSITLKGLSIQGESQVPYTETLTSAQADAEKALSQQKIPRAYQKAVREYFNDLDTE